MILKIQEEESVWKKLLFKVEIIAWSERSRLKELKCGAASGSDSLK